MATLPTSATTNRWLSLLPLVLLGLSVGPDRLGAQTDGADREGVDPRIRTELIEARDRIWRAWFANDRPILEAMLPGNFVGIGFGDAPPSGRAEAIDGAAGFVAAGGSLRRLEFTDDRFQEVGTAFAVYSRYTVEMVVGGEVVVQSGRATELFLKRGDRWINAAWHLDSGR